LANACCSPLYQRAAILFKLAVVIDGRGTVPGRIRAVLFLNANFARLARDIKTQIRRAMQRTGFFTSVQSLRAYATF
jgi:hypothetical protein